MKQHSGPGRLTWAWLVLILMIGAIAITIHLTGNPKAGEKIVSFDVNASPETMAPPAVPQMAPIAVQTASLAPQAESPNTAPPTTQRRTPSGSKIITLPAAQPEPLNEKPQITAAAPQEDRTEQGKAERLQIMQDATAKVIKLDDLPQTGKKPSNSRTVISTPPPPPNGALFTTTKNGPYPQIAADGRRASSYYRRGFKASSAQPQISIIVGGLGLSATLTDQAIRELPAEITLAFAPYGKNLEGWADQARAAGHELMIELPMEATGMNPDQLGPAGLLSTRSPLENEQRMDWLLSRFAGYFGVTNYLGNKLSTDKVAFAPILDQLRISGAAFIGDNEISTSITLNGPPSLRTDILIGADTGQITGKLEAMEKLAKSKRQVLVKIYPTGQSIGEISNWVETLSDKGIILAPASAALARNQE